MKITGEELSGRIPFERMNQPQLISRGLVIKQGQHPFSSFVCCIKNGNFLEHFCLLVLVMAVAD